MAKAYSDFHVLPHGQIERLTENLWWVQGSLPNMSLKRVMTVVRLEGASPTLVIHNAIALEESLMREIEAWGTPEYLLVPNGYHRLDAPAFKQRYPNLKVFTPPGSRSKVREVVPVDGSYLDFPDAPNVELHTLPGVGEAEGSVIVRSADGRSVILNDVVFNMDRPRDLPGLLLTAALGSAPGPRVSRLAKLALIKDRAALKAELLGLAALPDLQRVIVSHEKVAHGPEARRTLELAAGYL
ncbi:MAG TPA: hypothetical protein VFN67_02430 [Polyangiales bacterium]|nr:hypothetical protein [Polyangiales bacterium]